MSFAHNRAGKLVFFYPLFLIAIFQADLLMRLHIPDSFEHFYLL